MFSAEATIQGTQSTRNPRRRHRTTSQDSITTKQIPKRQKRSALTPGTFVPPNNSKTNGHAKIPNGTLVSKQQSQDLPNHQDASSETTTLSLRSKGSKRGDREKRPAKQGEGVVLTKSDHYTVSRNPNIPEALRDTIRRKERWHASFADRLGYAVALTSTHAIVWQYAQRSGVVETSKPLQVKLPNVSSNHNLRDSLPIGTLVHDSGAGELALLVVTATGKVIYYESVANAANADVMRQKQPGLLGSVSGMLSGELITEVTEVDPDGFVLTTNAGRAIHLSVKDSQGRPAINIEVLRSNGATSVGFFGGLKSVFGGGWRRDIAAVRTGPLQGKNKRQCLIVTDQGLLQVWDCVCHSAKTLRSEINFKSQIADAMAAMPDYFKKDQDFRVLDFVLFPISERNESEQFKILLLIGWKDQRSMRYTLVDLDIGEHSPSVGLIRPVTLSSEMTSNESVEGGSRPRLLLPDPAHTAFIIFEKYFVMLSLANVEESPSSQLQLESNSLAEPFQDILVFVQGSKYSVVGCTVEPADRDCQKSTCLLLVNDFGLVSATALPTEGEESVVERRTAACRSRVEQAVFFGNLPDNLLDFRVGLEAVTWEGEEIESAAIKVSDSILDCTSKYIPAITPSMDHQLKQRANALTALIKLVGRRKLKQSTRWHLLWSAEKLATARAIWKTYTAHLAAVKPGDKVLLAELIDMMSEKYKNENNPEVGETDVVRHYLINDISRIELVIPWAEQAIEELFYKENVTDIAEQAPLISQACDIEINALEAAFQFREEHAELYGLGTDLVEDGIFQGNLEGVGEFWTSVLETMIKTRELADVTREFCLNNDSADKEGDAAVNIATLTKLAHDTPKLIRLCCLVYDERCRWLKAQPDTKSQQDGTALEHAYEKLRRDLLVSLIDIELPEPGIVLAEKYGDVEAIAEILSRSSEILNERLADPTLPEDEMVDAAAKLQRFSDKVESYFKTYGFRWANAFYTQHLKAGVLSDLTDQEDAPFMTEFLRSKPEYAKASWLNEIHTSKNYKKAMDDLVKAQTHDKQLWNKKIEISMGKLAALAALEQQQVDEDTATKILRKVHRRLDIVDIQEQLYYYMRPALRSAIDRLAEADLAMQTFGSFTESKPVLSAALRQNFEKLVAHEALDPEELIDALTLMTSDPQLVDDEGFADRRFFLALQLLDLSITRDEERKSLHKRIIWRRCLIQDDWASLNRTELKDDEAVAREAEDTALFKTVRAGYITGLLNDAPPIPPFEIIGSGTSLEDLRTSSRYDGTSDAAVKALATDMSEEDNALADAMEKGRLDMWWSGVVEGARAAIRREADEIGAADAEEQKERNFAEGRLGESVYAYTNGVADETDMDEDGDVEMD